jgi:ubiquinone/menaquinone biosynthesis C-methylase UbiE
VRLANHQLLVLILDKLGLIASSQKKLIQVARLNNIIWADATKRIPLPDCSVEVLYSSHMIEHLDREEVEQFFKEAHRVLSKNGIIRIVVPCLRKLTNDYLKHQDANYFLERIFINGRKPKTVFEKFRYLIIGERHHKWMYDGTSLIQLLSSMNFKDACVMKPGATFVSNHSALNLYERQEESVYVEAHKS